VSEFLTEKVNDRDAEHVGRMLVVETEQKYQALVENALAGIYIIDCEELLYANPYACELVVSEARI